MLKVSMVLQDHRNILFYKIFFKIDSIAFLVRVSNWDQGGSELSTGESMNLLTYVSKLNR